MLFTASLTIPANTPVNVPLAQRIPVHAGTVRRVWVRWRWGTARLCGCRLLREESQVWPLTPQEWFYSSVYPVEFDEEYLIDKEPYYFDLEAYNEDDLFSHRLWVAIEVLLEQETSASLQRVSIWT